MGKNLEGVILVETTSPTKNLVGDLVREAGTNETYEIVRMVMSCSDGIYEWPATVKEHSIHRDEPCCCDFKQWLAVKVQKGDRKAMQIYTGELDHTYHFAPEQPAIRK